VRVTGRAERLEPAGADFGECRLDEDFVLGGDSGGDCDRAVFLFFRAREMNGTEKRVRGVRPTTGRPQNHYHSEVFFHGRSSEVIASFDGIVGRRKRGRRVRGRRGCVGDWPGWRGAHRDDISTETGLLKVMAQGRPAAGMESGRNGRRVLERFDCWKIHLQQWATSAN